MAFFLSLSLSLSLSPTHRAVENEGAGIYRKQKIGRNGVANEREGINLRAGWFMYRGGKSGLAFGVRDALKWVGNDFGLV